MSNYYKVRGKSLTNIADAIRTKTGGKEKISLDQMSSAIAGITGGGDVNIAPLFVGDVGTYDANSPVLVTETFTGGGTPDAILKFGDMSIPYFKAKKLVAQKGIDRFVNNENLSDKFWADAFGTRVPLCQLELHALTDESLLVFFDGSPALIWVISTDSVYFTKEAGFEDGGVYVMDVWSLGGMTGVVSITAPGIPDTPTAGFMPVEVSIPLVDEELVITPTQQNNFISDGNYYKKIQLKGVPIDFNCSFTPATTDKTYWAATGKWFEQVTVKGVSLSTMKVLADIELETLPNKLEYILGEKLSSTGGIILRKYTDGTTQRVNLMNSDIYGYPAIDSPGVHTLVVQNTMDGITCRTTFKITVTEA